jgi:hypothetical protein
MFLIAKISDHKKFTNRVFDEIQKLPFGSLPKSELELVILDALVRSIEPNDSYSNIEKHFNELKSNLKLSQAQLRNKLLAAQLRYDSISEKDVENFILSSIQKSEYSVEGSCIVLSIFNPLLNDHAKSYFDTRSIISDTSFNKNILKINLNGFIQFLFQLDNISALQKAEIEKTLKHAKEEGLVKFLKTSPEKSRLDKIESVTAIGNNLLTIIEKVSPYITSLLS